MALLRRIVIVIALVGSVAQAQQGSPRALQRTARLQELQQIQMDARFRANRDIPPEERALIDYGGYVAFNYLSLDDNLNNNHVLRQYDFVAYARFQLDSADEVFLRFRTGYKDFNDGDSFDGHGDDIIDPDLDRAFYKFSLAAANAAYSGKSSANDLTIKAGRDLAYWANGLVLAEVLDGVVLDVSTPAITVEMLGGVTITRTVDFDPSRPNFDHNTRRGFFGSMVTVPVGRHNPFVYGLIQRDYNKDDTGFEGPIVTRFDYNSYYLGIGSTGDFTDRLHYGLEAAYEFGDTLSNSFAPGPFGGLFQIDQTRDNIHAWAMDARLDYVIPDEHQTRLGAELILASGDGDRGSTNTTFNGNRPNTKDNAFNSFGVLNTGLAFGPTPSNVIVGRVGASTFPLPGIQFLRRMQVGFDFFGFWKLRDDAPIDEVTTNETYLGVEPDIYLNWQIASDITLTARYGAFFPNSDAFPVTDDVRQFIYAGVTFAF